MAVKVTGEGNLHIPTNFFDENSYLDGSIVFRLHISLGEDPY